MRNNNNNQSDRNNYSGGGGGHNKNNNSNMHNNNQQQNTHHQDRRKSQNPHQPSQQHNPQQQQQHHQQQQQQQHHNQGYQGQRDRSGQRYPAGQPRDSSMGSRDMMNQNTRMDLGSVRFQPGLPTRELPAIETKADVNKKFTGRCRLFVGNLPHSTTEEKLRGLFEAFGEIGEVFLGPKSAFAFVKMDTRQNAEAARDALDCSMYEGRTLRVRLAAHAAAIRVKHLSPVVTNELLAYAFRYFGEIERAVVVVDDKGKSVGEGVVEYSRKQSALYAIKRCQQECFFLTASPMPVLVEPFDQQDEDEGLPEKSINRNSIEFKEQRDVGPRFAEPGSFEHTFGLRWKELYEVEKQKRDRLEQEIQEARKNLQDQIEYSRLEHDTMQLRNKLQQLEDNRLKLQHLKEQTISESQQREEHRRQQDMLIRQREDGILRSQQLGDPNGLSQQETALRMQANALQDLLSNQERSVTGDTSNEGGQTQHKAQTSNPETDTSMSTNQMNMMPPQMTNQPRTFADAAMMGLNQPAFIPVQQQMGMQTPMGAPNMYAFMQQQQQQPMQLTIDSSGAYVNAAPTAAVFGVPMQQGPRPQKFNRQFNNQSNNIPVIQSGDSGRPRKRGRY